jgi:hypothetical protein
VAEGGSINSMHHKSHNSTAAGVSSTFVQALDPEVRSLMLFLIDTLRAYLPISNAINQRSVKTILKNHYRDIVDLAAKIKYIRADELP